MIGLPVPPDLLELARRLTRGLLVGLGPDEEVRAARVILRDYENAMFVPAGPEALIPWRDAFFSKVIASGEPEPTTEILRVLAPGGIAYLAESKIVQK